MNNEKLSIHVEGQMPSQMEMVVTLMRTKALLVLALAYITGYLTYTLIPNIILALSVAGLFAVFFTLTTAKKSLALAKKFGNSMWTISKEQITIENKAFSITIPHHTLKKVRLLSPTMIVFEFNYSFQGRVLKTTEQTAQEIISLFAKE